jgi:hypothetical protein
MSKHPPHVLPRDGSTGPRGRVLRPTPPARLGKMNESSPPPKAFDAISSDASVVGKFEVSPADFAKIRGVPNPRQRAQAGESVVSPAATADAGGGLTTPAPIE